jgi:hypothetical protein
MKLIKYWSFDLISGLLMFIFVLGIILIDNYNDNTKLQQMKEVYQKYKVIHDRQSHLSKILSTYPLHGVEPYVYAVLVDTLSRKYNIDVEAIIATIDIETGRTWDPTQTSHANCKGIMQLKETTAELESGRIGIPYKKHSTVWSEIKAIEIGSSYLSRGVNKYGYNEGFKYYVGGSGFRSTEKAFRTAGEKDKTRLKKIVKYMGDYNNMVIREYKQLKLMND